MSKVSTKEKKLTGRHLGVLRLLKKNKQDGWTKKELSIELGKTEVNVSKIMQGLRGQVKTDYVQTKNKNGGLILVAVYKLK